jgi:hypothetical protein
MTRWILAILAIGLTTILSGSGCSATGVGDPCTPEQEYEPTFGGFNEEEVNVESKSYQCQTRLCLVNHFRGRVSCPYGQNTEGNAPSDPKAGGSCKIPGSGQAVTGPTLPDGTPADPKRKKQVCSQCQDRTADKAVYCSCRCANLQGQTNDGANYCTCPDGFSCQQLVTSIGAGDTGLTGAYCIKNNTKYDRNNACAATLDPNTPCR